MSNPTSEVVNTEGLGAAGRRTCKAGVKRSSVPDVSVDSPDRSSQKLEFYITAIDF